MTHYTASNRTRSLIRFSGIFLSLLLTVLACNLPTGAGQPSASQAAAGPIIFIQQPSAGQTLSVAESFDLLVTAFDENGVTRIDLFVNETLLISQTAPDENGLPTLTLTHPMIPTQAGDYTLMARAYNRFGEASDLAVLRVSAVKAVTSASVPSQYIAQEGDTTESIAQKTGTSPTAINNLNPGLQNGQPTPGQSVLVPPAAKPPAQAAVPAPGGNVQPANPSGNQASGLPGILPVFQPGYVSQTIPLADGVIQQPPVLFPAASTNPSGSFAPPSDYQITVNDCKVNISWKDNSSEEQEFEIIRNLVSTPNWGTGNRVPANTTSFEDVLSASGGLIGYEVNAVRTVGGQEVYAYGGIKFVQVPFSSNCAGGDRQIILQPVSLQYSNLAMTEGFINASLENFSAIRIPRGQQTSFPLGTWDNPFLRWIIPLPDLKPGDPVNFEIQASLLANRNTPPLAEAPIQIKHTFIELAAPDAKDKIHQAKNDRLTFTYRLWLEPWAGPNHQQDSTLVPAPYDLSLSDTADHHAITWKHDSPGVIDGFIVHTTYSCGANSQIETTSIVPKIRTTELIERKKQPVGCTCSHQVSAFGAFGESALSDPARGNCRLSESEERVFVTYKSLQIKTLSQPTSVDLSMFANASSLQLGSLLVTQGTIQFDPTQTTFVVNFASGDPRGIQVGFSIPKLCGNQVLIGKGNPNWKNASNIEFQISSADGNCSMIVAINGENSSTPLPQQPGFLPPPLGSLSQGSLVSIDLPLLETGTIEVPVNEAAIPDWSSAIQWNGGVIVGDNSQNRQMHGLLTFDLSGIPASNSGLVNATFTMDTCRNSGIPSVLQPFRVTITTGAYPLNRIEQGQCAYSQSVTGILQDVLARGKFSKLTFSIAPSGIDRDNQDDSVEFTKFKLTVSYYP